VGEVTDLPDEKAMPERKEVFTTLSGLPIPPYLNAGDGTGAVEELEDPGVFPFTRGIRRNMYRGRLWTMRQYAGFGDARETNERFRFLLSEGQTGLSVAFDLPTQMGLDSDDVRAQGEVGRVGVAVDSLADVEAVFEGIPLGRVSTSMTINAPAAILMLMYARVAERQGVSPEDIRGTVQNDILKEYVARGTYIFPPEPSLRLVADTFAYASRELRNFNPISVSGYHIREAGATAPQEIAFTLANGLAYVRKAKEAGLPIDTFAPRVSFFFNAHIDFFEEIAKYRAARRIWAKLMENEGARDPRSKMLRFHAQTAGSSLTAQDTQLNVVRVAVEALAAILGGAQSLHTNAHDEALALPTEASALLALRTQQVLAYETGVADAVDPLGGSFWLEELTRTLEKEAVRYLETIEAMGGAVRAVESGYMEREIQEAAYRFQRDVESGERRIVGVNAYTSGDSPSPPLQRIPEDLEARQKKALARVRRERDDAAVASALRRVEDAARGRVNLLEPLKEAVSAYATIGEMCGVMGRVFGAWRGRVGGA